MSYNGKRKKNIESTVSVELQYIKNTNLFLRNSIRVLPILIYLFLNGKSNFDGDNELINKKNLITLAVSAAFFNILGYRIAYDIPEGGYFGTFDIWGDGSAVETGYSDPSDNIFQTVFSAVATFVALRTVNNSKANFNKTVWNMLSLGSE